MREAIAKSAESKKTNSAVQQSETTRPESEHTNDTLAPTSNHVPPNTLKRMTPQRVLQLQKTVGNQAVLRMLNKTAPRPTPSPNIIQRDDYIPDQGNWAMNKLQGLLGVTLHNKDQKEQGLVGKAGKILAGYPVGDLDLNGVKIPAGNGLNIFMEDLALKNLFIGVTWGGQVDKITMDQLHSFKLKVVGNGIDMLLDLKVDKIAINVEKATSNFSLFGLIGESISNSLNSNGLAVPPGSVHTPLVNKIQNAFDANLVTTGNISVQVLKDSKYQQHEFGKGGSLALNGLKMDVKAEPNKSLQMNTDTGPVSMQNVVYGSGGTKVGVKQVELEQMGLNTSTDNNSDSATTFGADKLKVGGLQGKTPTAFFKTDVVESPQLGGIMVGGGNTPSSVMSFGAEKLNLPQGGLYQGGSTGSLKVQDAELNTLAYSSTTNGGPAPTNTTKIKAESAHTGGLVSTMGSYEFGAPDVNATNLSFKTKSQNDQVQTQQLKAEELKLTNVAASGMLGHGIVPKVSLQDFETTRAVKGGQLGNLQGRIELGPVKTNLGDINNTVFNLDQAGNGDVVIELDMTKKSDLQALVKQYATKLGGKAVDKIGKCSLSFKIMNYAARLEDLDLDIEGSGLATAILKKIAYKVVDKLVILDGAIALGKKKQYQLPTGATIPAQEPSKKAQGPSGLGGHKGAINILGYINSFLAQ